MNFIALTRRRKITLSNYIVEKKIFLAMSLLFLAGMFLGSIIIRIYGASNDIATLFSTYFQSRSNGSFFGVFFASFLSTISFITAAFLSGLFLPGAPVAAAISLIRGMGVGLISGYLFSTYSLNGIAFYSLIMLIPLYFSSVGIIYACDLAFHMSIKIASLALPNSALIRLTNYIKSYIKSYFIVVVFIAFAAILDAILTTFFIALFTF